MRISIIYICVIISVWFKACYISCFQGLPLFWTSARKRGFAFPDVVKLLSEEPARLCRLDNQKGSLVPGHDADLVIWDPEKEFTVSTRAFCISQSSACVWISTWNRIKDWGVFVPLCQNVLNLTSNNIFLSNEYWMYYLISNWDLWLCAVNITYFCHVLGKRGKHISQK